MKPLLAGVLALLLLLGGCGSSGGGDSSKGDNGSIDDGGGITGNCVPGSSTAQGRLCGLKGTLDLTVTWRLIGETTHDVMVFRDDPIYYDGDYYLEGDVSITANGSTSSASLACMDITSVSAANPYWCMITFTSGDANSYAFTKTGSVVSGLYAFAYDGENPLYEVLYDTNGDISGTYSATVSKSANMLAGGFVSLEDKERATRQIADRVRVAASQKQAADVEAELAEKLRGFVSRDKR
ncbi:MAG: hypothetical protein AB7E49_08800 [Campylobacterales bacterium]